MTSPASVTELALVSAIPPVAAVTTSAEARTRSVRTGTLAEATDSRSGDVPVAVTA